jgi:hypothetical protein
MGYVDAGDGPAAMASLISDFWKHPSTSLILTTELLAQIMYEVDLRGSEGARCFIEGLPRPPADEPGLSDKTPRDG